MSGTSLDGLDLTICNFVYTNKWNYTIEKCISIEYDNKLKNKLKNSTNLNAYDFIKLHRTYGAYIGEQINKFIKDFNKPIDYIASHGHTSFHEPDNNVTFQLGCGNYIAATCKIPVIADFRTMDIALGGQGAPLVPIGDKLLFNEYQACLNIGGFANISFDVFEKRVAYDICPANYILNYWVRNKYNVDYDKSGSIGRKGNINDLLLSDLNSLGYYYAKYPKSLGFEWVEKYILPLIEKYKKLKNEDILTSFYHHIAIQIANNFKENNIVSALVSGGGAYNNYLIELIKKYSNTNIVIPQNNIIEYKEALIFAFLGLLFVQNENNCLNSVTGAKVDNIGGCLFKIG